jgi:hypothetical protein
MPAYRISAWKIQLFQFSVRNGIIMMRTSVIYRKYRRPELHHLEVFLRVIEAKSFTRAAKSLQCTQPAVSQIIGKLEEIFGGDLFVRKIGRAHV